MYQTKNKLNVIVEEIKKTELRFNRIWAQFMTAYGVVNCVTSLIYYMLTCFVLAQSCGHNDLVRFCTWVLTSAYLSHIQYVYNESLGSVNIKYFPDVDMCFCWDKTNKPLKRILFSASKYVKKLRWGWGSSVKTCCAFDAEEACEGTHATCEIPLLPVLHKSWWKHTLRIWSDQVIALDSFQPGSWAGRFSFFF